MTDIAITIIGMIAAFLTAFLAEPVKIYFQNQSKLRMIREGIYRELFHNNDAFIGIVILLKNYQAQNDKSEGERGDENKNNQSVDIWTSKAVFKLSVKTQCYDEFIKSDLLFLYQLSEITVIHILYTHIKFMSLLVGRIYEDNEMSKLFKELGEDNNTNPDVYCDNFLDQIENYKKLFFRSCTDGTFDKKIIIRLLGRNHYKTLVKDTKEEIMQEKLRKEVGSPVDHKNS